MTQAAPRAGWDASRPASGQGARLRPLAWTFLALLAASGIRAVPAALMPDMAREFGTGLSPLAAGISGALAVAALLGPVVAAALGRLGPRFVVTGSLALLGLTLAATAALPVAWPVPLLWGAGLGAGAGAGAMVLGAFAAGRWAPRQAGLVTGLFGAAPVLGQALLLPAAASVAEAGGWRLAAWGLAALALLTAVAACAGLAGERPGPTRDAPTPGLLPPLSRDAALLLGIGFICGLSTSGLVQTHMVALCADHGLPALAGAGLLALMGGCNLLGGAASGWLSDRIDSRVLLAACYALRGAALLSLGFSAVSLRSLSVFAVCFGLDWAMTMPPLMRLAADAAGRGRTVMLLGWLALAHQGGAAAGAGLAGVLRDLGGDYVRAFLLAGLLCLLASVAVLGVGAAPLFRKAGGVPAFRTRGAAPRPRWGHWPQAPLL
ncbi:MAG TPA: MFS transporter [Acetobacteraceae bacterium]|nr:MFS transporter [Acetobacteraceae bacterium]